MFAAARKLAEQLEQTAERLNQLLLKICSNPTEMAKKTRLLLGLEMLAELLGK